MTPGPDIEIVTPTQTLSAYLRLPAGDGPWPGVVVVHDIFGQTRDSRRQVDWLAAAGFLTIAPDLYSRGRQPMCVLATMRAMLTRRGAAFDDIEAARSALARRDDCTGNVGIIGFCMGGGFALLLAADERFAASSVNYGMVPQDVAALLAGACPVVGSFGADDVTLVGAARRLTAALERSGVAHDVKEYPGVGHSFMNDHGGALGWVMARVGTRFDAGATSDARARVVAFFERHLTHPDSASNG